MQIVIIKSDCQFKGRHARKTFKDAKALMDKFRCVENKPNASFRFTKEEGNSIWTENLDKVGD